MADVKIRIEVNPNAESEVLGDIQNQINNTASSDNVSNVSVKTDSIGIFQNIPSSSGGINGLSLAQDLVFDENGYLDNADLQGGVIESSENPVEFIWGAVPESGEYSVKLVFANAQNLKDIIVYGDSVVNQFPTQAIVDGSKTIYNDDLQWAINLQEESDTHTIEFTHWNKVNYNACLSCIAVMMKYLDIDKYTGLKNIESLSQSSSDTTGIFYGVLENSGSLELLDRTGELDDLLSDGVIDNSNTKVEIIANGKSVQHHISTDSSYNRNTQIMSVELGNRLNSLDILKYKGYAYPDHSERLSVLFFDVLSNLRYALFGKDKELTEEEFKQMLSAQYDATKTLYEYLYSVEVQYPVIEANKTYREVIDEFCLIAQMQMYIDDNDNVRFVSARPKVFDENFKAIHIPKKNMFSQLDYNVILKNKYDGVEISKTNVNDVIDYDTVVFSDTYDKSSLTIDSSEEKQGYNSTKFTTVNGNYDFRCVSFIDANYNYVKGSLNIPKSFEDNLSQILKVEDFNVENTEADEKTFSTYQIKYGVYTGDITSSVIWYKSSNKVSLNQDITIPNLTYKNDVTEQGYVKDYNESIIKVTDGSMTVDVPVKSETASLKPQITIEDKGSYYYVEYKLCFGKELSMLSGKQQYNDLYASELNVNVSGTHYSYIPLELSLSIYGNKRTITFNQIQVSTENIEFAKTKVSLGSSTLIQTDAVIDTIKNNILADYMQGVSNASVSISCNDYFDKNGRKVIDWAKGEIPQVNQVIYFDNDFYSDGKQRYWKIKGRTFRKTGVPMVDLELEEINNKKLEDFSWAEIKQISDNGGASSVFSIGDEKKVTLSNGETLTMQIAGFNKKTLADNSKQSSIVFVTKDAIEGDYVLYENYADTWETCIMRTETLPNIFKLLPLDLQNSISNVKNTIQNPVGNISVYDNIWLLNAVDIFFGYQTNFPLFKNKNNIAKGYKWWLRPDYYDISDSYYVNSDGERKSAFQSDMCKIIFGFCI